MKIVVFGGAGDMGSRAVEDLAGWNEVEVLTIADRNVAAAQKVAAGLKGARARIEIKEVDANDHGALVAVMAEHDLAASALGPFFMFESKLVEAAIEARTNYCSICDEWQPALELFDNYADRARAAGVTVLTGLGASPGLTNVGIRFLSQQMDKVNRADVFVYQPLDAGGGVAVVQHMLHIISRPVEYRARKQPSQLPACSVEEVVDFPGFGPLKVWNMGHSEPVTVPRYFTDIDEVRFLMGFGKGSDFFIQPARLGLFRIPFVAKFVSNLLKKLEGLDKNHEAAPGSVRLDVHGTKDGKPVTRMLCGTGEMRNVTGLSLAVGARLLAEGRTITKEPGVYAPEGLLEPERFIELMQEKGLNAYEDIAMTKPLLAKTKAAV